MKAPQQNGLVGKSSVILEARKLTKYFPVKSKLVHLHIGWVKAVDDVTLGITKGESFGLVGESGCGKSTLGKTLMGIYQPTKGEVYFEGNRTDNLPLKKRTAFLRNVQYLHQDPASCLNPWWRVEAIVREPLMIHRRNLTRKEMDSMVRKSLLTVGLDEYHAERYPHEFSGGQQRRIALARILILGPSVVIFDEPTSGVDVSVQATILKLLEKIKKLYALTYVHISHNLDVIRLVSDRIAVMYLGKIVEVGDVTSTAENALHPYTRILFSAVPKIGRPRENSEPEVLITGEPPDPQYPPSGCHFHPRCPISQDICTKENPVLRKVAGDRFVACHIAEDGLTK